MFTEIIRFVLSVTERQEKFYNQYHRFRLKNNTYKMVFDLGNKVALITGGATGLGFIYAKELLANGARGVTLADMNSEQGATAVEEITSTFGAKKAIFVKTDVTVYEEFEAAFQETIKQFGNVDILINNAGILNDALWETEILININGTVHGNLLGMEKYLPKYKTGEEAVIVNISSVAGIQGYPFVPVYVGTKHAVLGMVKSWGNSEFYEETKVRVIGICPGVTITPMITEIAGRNFGDRYESYLHRHLSTWPTQQPEYLGKEVIEVIKFAPNGTSWVIESGEPAYLYAVPDRSTMKHNQLSKD